jgi:hypothetical protein
VGLDDREDIFVFVGIFEVVWCCRFAVCFAIVVYKNRDLMVLPVVCMMLWINARKLEGGVA